MWSKFEEGLCREKPNEECPSRPSENVYFAQVEISKENTAGVAHFPNQGSKPGLFCFPT